VSTPSRSPSLLAYVFWHWPLASTAAQDYEHELVSFHASLASQPPTGFLGSAAFGLDQASWLPSSQDGYEDWYLVRDRTVVGELNHDAVAAVHAQRHDRVAHQAQDGAGGLYALRGGDEQVGAAATWFAKPADWSYAELDHALEPQLTAGHTFWQRQMVLGPAPEFCLRASTTPTLPAPLSGQQISYRTLS